MTLHELKQTAIVALIISSTILLAISMVMLGNAIPGRVVKYNCSISEISPDYPIDVKEECRKLNAQRSL